MIIAGRVERLLTFTHAAMHALAWLIISDPSMTARPENGGQKRRPELGGPGSSPRAPPG